MTIEDLQAHLHACIAERKNKPTDEVVFRHSIHTSDSIYSPVDYLLTKQLENTLILCYDDGDH
jgi:hypothetical protein